MHNLADDEIRSYTIVEVTGRLVARVPTPLLDAGEISEELLIDCIIPGLTLKKRGHPGVCLHCEERLNRKEKMFNYVITNEEGETKTAFFHYGCLAPYLKSLMEGLVHFWRIGGDQTSTADNNDNAS